MAPQKRKQTRPTSKKGGQRPAVQGQHKLTPAEVRAIIRTLKALKSQSDADIEKILAAKKIDPKLWSLVLGPDNAQGSIPRSFRRTPHRNPHRP